ncbi:two-component system regulatory protein YycI [Bacillus sp. V5-8f]|uniref:two-component system regulatory protein YycI n=1 Tax=Bacillus sp. V5-8f TaxID=2053044 RepID=UPI000C7872A3|nr:two-component system regulatory protein YycI [Bacillus sp. V5-8f]PLT36019.1 transcriptional regulator [Bacillus sp. V5-8f]
MDWSKTKTIFIMVFLVLDIFLLYQFLEKKKTNQMDYLTVTSTEEQMKQEQITIPDVQNEPVKESILMAKRKEFSKEDIKDDKNQEWFFDNKTRLIATLKKTTIVGKDFDPNQLAEFLKENIYEGQSYKFWEFDRSNNTIIYYQSYGNKTFYNNTNAKLVLRLNEKREIVSYEQTYLENIKPMNKKEEILPVNKAIVALYSKGALPENTEITNEDVELGYYSLLKSSSSSYLLTPTWRISVNGKDMFVKAFDGEVIELDTEEKIQLE